MLSNKTLMLPLRRRRPWAATVGPVLVALSMLEPVRAQCELEWSPQFPAGTIGGLPTSNVSSFTVFDQDGAGPNPPALIVGGTFVTAGGVPANYIAKWDGYAWSALGEGLGGPVFALAVYDDDGAGPHAPVLVAGGSFNFAGTLPVNKVAKWNGIGWSALGNGTNNTVYALHVFDPDGTGSQLPVLCAGGSFTAAGSVSAKAVAAWDGSVWSPLGPGIKGYVTCLASWDADDSGPGQPTLYAGGGFTQVYEPPPGLEQAADRIARWDGTRWWPLQAPPPGTPPGVNGVVNALATYDPDGSGPEPSALYLGGNFTTAGNTQSRRVARWNGTTWSAVGEGFDGSVNAFGLFDADYDGPELPALYAAGVFISTGDGDPNDLDPQFNRIAAWDGTTWSTLGTGLDSTAAALAVFDDDGAGTYPPALYAGGHFSSAGGVPAGRIAHWGCALDDWPPVIADQPDSAEVCPGESTTLSVAAWGSPPLGYQWYKDGVELGGATASTYTTPPMNDDIVGNYHVVVSNPVGETISSPAVLTMLAETTISVPPAGETVCEGEDVLLTVGVMGSGPFTYQWFQDGLPKFGAWSPEYFIADIDYTDVGEYTVLVTGACGAVLSEGAYVNIIPSPWIITPPQSQEACAGDTVTFSVEADGPPPITYQWRKNLIPLPGAQSFELTLTNIDPNDAATYDVVVGGGCTGIVSEAAVLTISSGPAIVEQPQSQTACLGSAVTLTVSATGVPPLLFEWYKNNEPLAGASADTYTIAAVAPDDAGEYYVVVIGACGDAVSSAPAALAIDLPPTITVSPTPALVCEGAEAHFSVEATGTAPLSYQWRRDGLEIAGAESAEYSVTADPNATGTYDVLVSNACGDAVSAAAPLEILPATEVVTSPASQEVCAGADVVFNVLATGAPPLQFQWQRNDEKITGALSDTLVLTDVSLDSAGAYTVEIIGSCGTVTSAAAVLTVNTPPEMVTPPQPQTPCVGAPASFVAEFAGSPPLSYQWYKDGESIAGANTAVYDIAAVTLADAGMYHVQAANSCGTLASTAAELSPGSEPVFVNNLQDAAACAGQPLTLEVMVIGLELTYTWFKDEVEIAGAGESRYEITAVAPSDVGAYRVEVGSACGVASSATAHVTLSEPPGITQQPASGQVCAGGDFAFSVAASGTPPLNYQWYRDASLLPGETAPTLTLSDAAETGSYWVRVSNPCASVDSVLALLVVDPGPAVLAQPESQGVCVGDAFTLNVQAAAPGPLTYQWQKDEVDLVGAVAAQYTVAAAAVEDAGTYRCVVAGDCGAVFTTAALVTVGEGPFISDSPQSQVTCVGAPVTFAVEAHGQVSGYEWYKDGNPISGATGPVYEIPAAALSDAGDYYAVANSACGATPSAVATLLINAGPLVVTPPHGATVCAGAAVNLTVDASGTAPLEFQWLKDGAELPNAIDPTYTLPTASAGDAGQYAVRISNVCGTLTTDAVALLVTSAPAIRTQPLDQDVCLGSAVEFTVAADGDQLSFQWRKDGVALSAGNAATLRLSSVLEADAGVYDVLISASCGSVTSSGAVLAVQDCPSPPAPPADPVPPDDSTGVSTTVELRWSADETASAFDVYVGATDDPELAGEVTETRWTARGLTAGTRYTWRVVSHNDAGRTAGPLWSFTTTPAGGDPPDSNDPPADANEPPVDANEPTVDANEPDDGDTGRPDPNDPNQSADPPGDVTCGGGGCGAGAAGTIPLTFALLCGWKATGYRVRRRRY